jgi:hypothetical protein
MTSMLLWPSQRDTSVIGMPSASGGGVEVAQRAGDELRRQPGKVTDVDDNDNFLGARMGSTPRSWARSHTSWPPIRASLPLRFTGGSRLSAFQLR